MKKIITLLLSSLLSVSSFAAPAVFPVSTSVNHEAKLSSTILLWMRADKPRQVSMDRWAGPHAKIISANPSLSEYRQLHFKEVNTGLWPAIEGVQTQIPADRKIDGVADVTLKSYDAIALGEKQSRLAQADEINLFSRTLLYAASPDNSKWYQLNAQPTQTRVMVFIRKRDGISESLFQQFINQELAPSLANLNANGLTELRSHVYGKYNQAQWDSPNVAHDNPPEAQFQAALILGFQSPQAMTEFFESEALKPISQRLAQFSQAVHAYQLEKTLIFIDNGKQMPAR
ncbi:strictosidine synthase [Neisseria yangbaofengii]|uniref:strictosidine synthase n=1 Tax=Neisseria yangbaofengii TaxID=2709396 RepID=UPI0013ECA67E|nr:strictosidine synthase [Neisseria yangbaofengii]